MRAHPALVLASADASDVDAMVDCGSGPATKGLPTIRVVADSTPTQPRGALQWSSAVVDARRVELDTGRLRLAAHLQARSTDGVLLAIGDEPVIVARGGASKLLETSLDPVAIAAGRGPELPLLLNFMVDTLLGPGLLDEIAVIDRGPRSSFVVPLPSASIASAAAATQGISRTTRDAVWPVLVVALLALLWEVVALVRQGLRLGARDVARSV